MKAKDYRFMVEMIRNVLLMMFVVSGAIVYWIPPMYGFWNGMLWTAMFLMSGFVAMLMLKHEADLVQYFGEE